MGFWESWVGYGPMGVTYSAGASSSDLQKKDDTVNTGRFLA